MDEDASVCVLPHTRMNAYPETTMYDLLSTDILDHTLDILQQGFTATALNKEHKHVKGNNMTDVTMCNTVCPGYPNSTGITQVVINSEQLMMQSLQTMMQTFQAECNSPDFDEANMIGRFLPEQPNKDKQAELLYGSSSFTVESDASAVSDIADNANDAIDILRNIGDLLPQHYIDHLVSDVQTQDGNGLHGGQTMVDVHSMNTKMGPTVHDTQRAVDVNTDLTASFNDNWGDDTQYPHSNNSAVDCGRLLDPSIIDQLMNIPTDEILGIPPTAAMDISITEPSPIGINSSILSADVKNGLNYQYTIPNPPSTGTATPTATSLKTSSIKDVLKEKINVKRQHLGQEQLTVDFGNTPSYELTAEEKKLLERRKKLNRDSANRSRISRQKKSKDLKKVNAASERINQMLMKQIEALKQDKNLLEYKWKLHQRLFHGADGSRKPVARMSANDLLDPTEKNLASNNKL